MMDVQVFLKLYFTNRFIWLRQQCMICGFICRFGIHICSVSESLVCSSRSRRVAFSREIWRAIYRSLPEHHAWCCCCCSCLSLLLTTPASDSLTLSIFVISHFPLLMVFCTAFPWMSYSLTHLPNRKDHIHPFAVFDVNYWLKLKCLMGCMFLNLATDLL